MNQCRHIYDTTCVHSKTKKLTVYDNEKKLKITVETLGWFVKLKRNLRSTIPQNHLNLWYK